jgi:hypothetical protein
MRWCTRLPPTVAATVPIFVDNKCFASLPSWQAKRPPSFSFFSGDVCGRHNCGPVCPKSTSAHQRRGKPARTSTPQPPKTLSRTWYYLDLRPAWRRMFKSKARRQDQPDGSFLSIAALPRSAAARALQCPAPSTRPRLHSCAHRQQIEAHSLAFDLSLSPDPLQPQLKHLLPDRPCFGPGAGTSNWEREMQP